MNLAAHIDDLMARRSSPPPMYQPPAWNPPGPTTKNWPAILVREFNHRGAALPQAYRLQLRQKKHAPLADAMGLNRISERLYECVAPEQIAVLAAFANDALAPRIHEDFPGIAETFSSNLKALFIPPAPTLEWSHLGMFIFIGGPAYIANLEAAGWWRDPRSGFFMTHDAWLAAAYLRQATPQARSIIMQSGLGADLANAFTKQPVHGPFMVPAPDRQTFNLFAGTPQLNDALMRQKARFNDATGAYVLSTVGQSRPFIDLLHPAYRRFGAKISASDALIDTDGTAISDLIALTDDEEARGSGKRKPDAPALTMTFHAPTNAWRTTDVRLALDAGFTQSAPGIYETSDVDVACKIRQSADMASELAIQVALADRYAAHLSQITPLPLPVAPPGEEYSSDQIDALRFMSVRQHTLVADDMGLGKTPLSCGAIEMFRPKYTLIVCMPQSVEAWRRHVEKWTVHKPRIHLARPDTPVLPGVTIISDGILARAKHLMAHRWDLAIIDEVHRFKADDSARAAAIYDATDGIIADRTIDLSGTPIPNRPQDLFNLLHHKLPEIFHSREAFHRLYGVENLEKSVVDAAAARRRRTLGDILRKTIMIRRLKNLPVRKTRKTLAYEIDDPTLVANLAAEQKALQRYETTKRTVDRTKILAELNRLRCETSLHKVPFVADLLQELISEGRTPLVFGHHHVVIDKLAAELERRGLDFGKIHGGATTAAQRQQIVDRFQNGVHQGLIAGIKSGGTSLTITRADCVVFIEIDWTPYDLVQAEDRAYRRGQLNDVLVLYIVIRNSVDSHVATVNNLKIRIASEILDPLPDEIAELQTIAA